MTKPYIKTLDDTSWTLYDIIGPIGTGTQRFVLDFSSGATTFTSMTFEGDISEGTLYFDSTPVVSYPACVWADADYKALTIAGGVDAANPSLLAWFSQYARSTSPSSGDNAISTALYDIVDAIRESGSDIPDPSTADVGDVLTKGESGLEWAPSEGLPAVSSSDNGKVLGVSNGAWDKVNSLETVTVDVYSPDFTEGHMDCYWTSSDAEAVLDVLRKSVPYKIFVIDANGDIRQAYVREYSLSRGYESVTIVCDDSGYSHLEPDPLDPSLYITVINTGRLVLSAVRITPSSDLDTNIECISQYGIPFGGDTGQVLKKPNNADGSVDWYDVHEIPSGGTTGQVLKKASNTNYDVTWANESGGGGGDAIMTLIPIVNAGFNITGIVDVDGNRISFLEAASLILEAGSETPNRIFKLLMKDNDSDTGVFFDSEAYVTGLTGLSGDNTTGTITFKIPDIGVSGLSDIINQLDPGRFPVGMTDLYIKWIRQRDDQDYVESFIYVPACCSIPTNDDLDVGTEFLCWNGDRLEFRYPTQRLLDFYNTAPDINYAVSLGLSAFIQDALANGSSTQVVDMSGSDYKGQFDNLIGSTAFVGDLSLAYDFWVFDWNGTTLPFRVINSAMGIELRSMFVYPVQSVGIFNLDITVGFFGYYDSDSQTYSNEMIVISGTSTPLSSITPIVPPSPPSND